jgi:hypothetical protein
VRRRRRGSSRDDSAPAFDVKTFVEFRSSKFPPYDGEEEQINPGLWGKRLAEYLVARLAEHGLKADDIIAEDWGWYIPMNLDGAKVALCCGHQGGDDDQFLCFTDPQQPVLKRLFKKIDMTPHLTRVTEALDKILSVDPEIGAISWREP